MHSRWKVLLQFSVEFPKEKHHHYLHERSQRQSPYFSDASIKKNNKAKGPSFFILNSGLLSITRSQTTQAVCTSRSLCITFQRPSCKTDACKQKFYFKWKTGALSEAPLLPDGRGYTERNPQSGLAFISHTAESCWGSDGQAVLCVPLRRKTAFSSHTLTQSRHTCISLTICCAACVWIFPSVLQLHIYI